MEKINVEKKTYCSVEDFEKDFFPILYKENLSVKQGDKILFGAELANEFSLTISQELAN